MSGQFHFELVSPEAKLLSREVAYVSVPAEEGDIGVFAGHSPFLTALRTGVISIKPQGLNDNTAEKRFFVMGGFADIGTAHCTILAESAIDLSLIDVTALDAEIENLKAAGNYEALAVAQAKRAAIS